MNLVCLHSLASAGMVGLRPFLRIWGEELRPVPTLLLNAPGDHPHCRRFGLPLAAHFESVLALDDEPVAVFVGYLASDTQLTEVVGVLDRHPKRIARVIVDPVSGDQGRAYVAPDLIAAWPQLLERADLAFPNATELSLIVPGGPHDAIDRWRDRFPRLDTIVTGVPVGGHSLRSVLHRPGRPAFWVDHLRRPGHYRGTGDAFAAVCLHEHLARHIPLEPAIAIAASRVSRGIDRAAARGMADLCLDSQD
jgi:pyridoxal/pyridoxine/pyridoxamine kinase